MRSTWRQHRDQETASAADRQHVHTACLHCAYTTEGELQHTRIAHLEHLKLEHPEHLPKPKRRKPRRSYAP